MNPQILLADDAPMIEFVVKTLLGSEFAITVAHNTAQMFTHLQHTRFDLLLLDLDLGDGVAIPGLLPQIKEWCDKVIVYSNTLNDAVFHACMVGAADGYLVKNGALAELKAATCAVLAGHQRYPYAALCAYAALREAHRPDLRKYEVAVLAYLLCEPLAKNAMIAAELGLSKGRVGNILTGLYRHFGVGSRLALIAAATSGHAVHTIAA